MKVILKDGAPLQDTKQMSAAKVRALVEQGIWTDEDLARHGLVAIEKFAPPEGKVAVGPPRYVRNKGKWQEEYDVADAPEPLTAKERFLLITGLSEAEARAVLADLVAER